MKKIIKKTVSLLLIAIMAVSMAACGKKGSGSKDKNSNKDYSDRTEVKMKFWRSGLGEDFIQEMVDAFNVKQTKYYVTVSSTSSMAAVTNTLGLETEDETDLYVGLTLSSDHLEPLEDILDYTVEGESKSLKEKFRPIYLENTTASDGHIYQLTTGGGNLGIVYNKALFKAAGMNKAPRTTDELVKACSQLKDNDIIPFIHFTSGGYWTYYVSVWQAQYDGYDYWRNTWCANKDASGKSPSKEVFLKKDGRYEVLKVLEQLLNPDNIEKGSNSLDHISAQTMFLNSDIGMMVTGSWITKEMEGKGSLENYEMMKNPVVSAIVDKLTSVNNDMQLRDLVDAIDAVTDGKASIDEYRSGNDYKVGGVTVSAADWERVTEARNMVQGTMTGGVGIPKYSTEKEGAKEFLKFFYSDAGYQIFADCTRTVYPMELSTGELLDTSKWNSFEKKQYDVMRNSKYYIGDGPFMHDIFVYGGADAYGKSNYIIPFGSRNAAQRKTADQMWETVIENFEINYDSWAKNIE